MQCLCGLCQEPVSSASSQYVDSKTIRSIVSWLQEVNKNISPSAADGVSQQWCQMCYGLAHNATRSLTHLAERLTSRRDSKVRVKLERSGSEYSCGSALQDPGKQGQSIAMNPHHSSVSPHPGLGSPQQHSMNGEPPVSLPKLIDQIKSLNQGGQHPGAMQFHSMMGSPPKLLSPSGQHGQVPAGFGLSHPGLSSHHQGPAPVGPHQAMPFPYMFLNSQVPHGGAMSQSAFTPTRDHQREQPSLPNQTTQQYSHHQDCGSTNSKNSSNLSATPSKNSASSSKSKHPSLQSNGDSGSMKMDDSIMEEGLSTGVKDGNNLSESDLHKCFVCRKVFTNSKWLRAHMTRHKMGNEFVCSECNKTFTDRRNFRRHCRLHSDDTPYKCEVCGKKCGRNKDLKNHMKSHETERTYLCKICGKSFKHQHGLNQHVATHNSPKMSFLENISNGQMGNINAAQTNSGIQNSRVQNNSGMQDLVPSSSPADVNKNTPANTRAVINAGCDVSLHLGGMMHPIPNIISQVNSNPTSNMGDMPGIAQETHMSGDDVMGAVHIQRPSNLS